MAKSLITQTLTGPSHGLHAAVLEIHDSPGAKMPGLAHRIAALEAHRAARG